LRRCYASVPSHHESRAGRPETRCAQTSGRLIPLTIRAARRYAQGAEYRQARWRSLKVTICVGRLAKRKPTRTQPRALSWVGSRIDSPLRVSRLYSGPVWGEGSSDHIHLDRALIERMGSGSARNPGVFSFASFRLDEQTKGSRTAVRNQGFDKLVSAERLMARTARFLDEPRR
jgi:hypothetical protein